MVLLVLSSAASAQEASQKPNYFLPPGRLAAPGTTGAAWNFEYQLTRLGAKNPAIRKEAVNALGVPGNVRAVPPVGTVLLKLNEPVENRVAAAMALGRIGNWRASSFLRQAMKDSAKEVRFSAALALGKIKSLDSLPILVDALTSDPEWWVRFAAAVALAEDRDPVSVRALAGTVEHETEWQVRMQAVRSLGQIGSRDAAYALAKPLKDRDASVRAATAMALGDIGGVESVKILSDALKTERDEFPRQVIGDVIKRLLAQP